MADFTQPHLSARPSARFVRIMVVVLLALYLVMTVGASLRKGLTFDEGEELAIGYNVWLHQDFRMESANGDLVKRWATLPYLFTQPKFPDESDPFWRDAQTYDVGFNFFFMDGNLPDWLLLQGRLMMALMGAATGLLIFFCAKEIFGGLGGLVSLGLFVFSPHMLAFGGMAATEMSVCFTLLGTVWCVWRLLHEVTWGRLVRCMVFTALLVLAKPTALVIFPITAVLVAVKYFAGKPLVWRLGRERVVHSRVTQLGIFLALGLLNAAGGWLAIWANYDFRYAASPNPADPGIKPAVQRNIDSVMPSVAKVLIWCREERAFPEGFLDGIKWLLQQNDQRQAFMNGQWRIGGWRTFFPYALWAKTSPALLLLMGLGVAGWWLVRHQDRRAASALAHAADAARAPPIYEAVPYVTLVAVYIAVAMAQDVDIGHRHVLAIYPAIYVLGGVSAILWTRGGIATRCIISGLVLWFVVESLAMYPDYLAYFSPFVGGPAQGYKCLVDSSLDWGQDLPALQRWLDTNNPNRRDEVYLAYFGTDYVNYRGIHAHRLPDYPDWLARKPFPLGPGIYAISATLYESLYTDFFGPWNRVYENQYQFCLKNMEAYDATENDPAARHALFQKYSAAYWENLYGNFDKLRFARLCAWLRQHRAPEGNAGYSILIWRLSESDLQNAILGPPAELLDEPVGG
jgi:4-amino-4-deoxy-L-arabinose transferase-like glycosyltransferase